MDLPAKLTKLNFIRQKTFEEEEIKNTRDDIVSLIKESSQKALINGFGNNSKLLERKNAQKFNSLLSSNSIQRKLDIFDTFIKYPAVSSIDINIPTTIVRNENFPSNLVQTAKTGKVVTRPCSEEEYYNIETEYEENAPLYIYKALNKEGDLMHSKESAKTVWNSSKETAKMQHYILSFSNPASIIRVLWVDGAKTKYFSIINYKKLSRKVKTEPKPAAVDPGFAQKRRLSTFDYRTLLNKSSQSINNPFKVKSEKESVLIPKGRSKSFSYSTSEEFYASINPPKETKNNLFTQISKDNSNEFLVNPKNPEKCFVVETKGQFPEISAMTAKIIEFLNKYPFKDNYINGIVLDFIQNRDKKWFLLKCKEFANSLNTSLRRSQPIKIPETISICFRRQRNKYSSLDNSKVEEFIVEAPEQDLNKSVVKSTNSLAGLYRNKSNPKPIPENELYDKCYTLNERSDKIANNEGEMSINSMSTAPQKCPFYFADSSPMSCLFSSVRRKNPLIINHPTEIFAKAKKPSFSTMVDTFVKNHINTIVDNLDEMNLSTQATKVKNENLVEKYGGKPFWDQFIFSLCNKILENNSLIKYFKCAKLENFTMIVSGMFNLFNGTIDPKFRRRIRAAHQPLELSEKEFNSFSDIYESTLVEFQIKELDKSIMMAQIRSLKTLVCKQGTD
ncbi:unnamed protein product [Blepharisma stoltei]|uniref:Uncharacterized protein n=1 Tax=Blepharisma stoltei TaxID=1481888 RepID=A0AAU9KA67_9CILI|nr:unnamed protein product [Blepharisma stoltei]